MGAQKHSQNGHLKMGNLENFYVLQSTFTGHEFTNEMAIFSTFCDKYCFSLVL